MLSDQEIMEYVQGVTPDPGRREFGLDEAKDIGEALGLRWDRFDVAQFAMGLNVELEHGQRTPATDVTHDEPLLTGKIALAHLNKFPDYYTRLARMESEAERDKNRQRRGVH
jgi:hypothetical protein